MSAHVVTAPPELPGYFGKVPMRGDFVTRRMPRSFLDPWDSWLQDAIGTSRKQMGDGWLSAYLSGPVWRFVLSPGLCGTEAAAGLLMPSGDAVGRYFPFALAVTVPGCANPARLVVAGADWFRAAEPVLFALFDEGYDFNDFDQALAQLGLPPTDAGTATGRSEPGTGDAVSTSGWRLPLDPTADVAVGYPDLVHHLLLNQWACYSLWWTSGSANVAPSLLVSGGLPPAEGFAAFLDGGWERWGWNNDRAHCRRIPG
jgi:type VI secretion system protein ImpM